MSDEMLTTDDVAVLVGVQPASIRQYRWRGVFPEPDGYVGRTPYWFRATVDGWVESRLTVGRPQKEEGQ